MPKELVEVSFELKNNDELTFVLEPLDITSVAQLKLAVDNNPNHFIRLISNNINAILNEEPLFASGGILKKSHDISFKVILSEKTKNELQKLQELILQSK